MATLDLQTVTDLDLPALRPYRTLRRRKDLERAALFVVEGDKVVQRLLESPYVVESLLLTPEWLDRIRPLLDHREERIKVFLAPKAGIEAVTGFGCYQGIKAVGRITQPVRLPELLSRLSGPRWLCALDGISNAENMGGIVRNAAALGVQALIVGKSSCSPFLTRAIRTSMGAVFRLPIVEDLALAEALIDLRRHGFRCLAAHPAGPDGTLPLHKLQGDVCLVLGSEGFGISPEILSACNTQIALPMERAVDSLNVSSAAAVFFYEIRRHREPPVRDPHGSPLERAVPCEPDT